MLFKIISFHICLCLIFAAFAFAGEEDWSGTFAQFDKFFTQLKTAKSANDRAAARQFISFTSELTLTSPEKEGDAKKLVGYVQRASDLNISCSQYLLSKFYFNGLDATSDTSKSQVHVLVKDGEESFKWLRKSAENGCPDGQYELARAYAKGEGVIENDKLSFKWFERSAKSGKIKGMLQASLGYFGGKGVSENDMKALAWVILAESEMTIPGSDKTDMDEAAQDIIPKLKQELKERLKQSKIEEAQELAAELKKEVDKMRKEFKG